jgi:asparagine synthetase B (glutamine-hydrolysing)
MKCRIGAMLSGGIDSAVIVAALVQHGVDLVAYHLQFSDAVADESTYARAVCQSLDVPLVSIKANCGPDYLSEAWRYPHPYGHAGLRFFELVAEQAERDGIAIIVTGRGGDPSFGPLATYGLSDVFAAPITGREKWAMLLGAISTDWLLPDLFKSIRPSCSLINESSLAPASSGQGARKALPFLRQHVFCSSSFPNLYDVTRFSPQDLTVEATIWRPHGIVMAHPYHDLAVQQLVAHLPAAYRLLPFRGMRIAKPVLRLSFADVLPPLVVRHRQSPWLSVPHQEYCLHAIPYLLQLLGKPTSQLVQRGILDPTQVQKFFTDGRLGESASRDGRIRSYYNGVIACAMTELFLRQFDPDQSLGDALAG